MNKALKYGAGLIATYLVVAYATGFGTAVTKGGGAVSQVVKTFQGR